MQKRLQGNILRSNFFLIIISEKSLSPKDRFQNFARSGMYRSILIFKTRDSQESRGADILRSL